MNSTVELHVIVNECFRELNENICVILNGGNEFRNQHVWLNVSIRPPFRLDKRIWLAERGSTSTWRYPTFEKIA